jgi:hypothetical protein
MKANDVARGMTVLMSTPAGARPTNRVVGSEVSQATKLDEILKLGNALKEESRRTGGKHLYLNILKCVSTHPGATVSLTLVAKYMSSAFGLVKP